LGWFSEGFMVVMDEDSGMELMGVEMGMGISTT